MDIKKIGLGEVLIKNKTVIGLNITAFSKVVGCSKATVQSALVPVQKGTYAPKALQHLLKNVFIEVKQSNDRFLRIEAIEDLLAYFGGNANRFKRPAAKAAIAEFAEYGGFVKYIYHQLEAGSELSQSELIKPPVISATAHNKEELSILNGTKLNLDIDWQQYKQDAQESKRSRLPRRIIPIGNGIEVFGLPGFEKKRGRYLLSQTNAAEAVGKGESSIRHFFESNASKVLLEAAPEFAEFTVENSQKPIIGIPPEVATQYWINQLSKSNLRAMALVSAFSMASLEHYADLEFGINRTKVEQVQRLQELFWRSEPGDYSVHFKKEYYDELYRVFPWKQTKPGQHPKIFATITKNYFYELMPGGTHDMFKGRRYFLQGSEKIEVPGGVQAIFNERKESKSDENYWHQYLTPQGDSLFLEAMSSFITFLRGLHPCGWDGFQKAYHNTYGKGFQMELDFPKAA